jgi:hypothetical protein
MENNKKTPETLKRRSFGGKIDNFKDKQERAFEQKHLNAYLKGRSTFNYGKGLNGLPITHKVKEIWS